MKESLDCDCGVCSICSGLRRPDESHEDAALRRGTQPTDVQQLKAEIAALVNNYPTDSWKYDSDRVNSLLAALRQLSAV